MWWARRRLTGVILVLGAVTMTGCFDSAEPEISTSPTSLVTITSTTSSTQPEPQETGGLIHYGDQGITIMPVDGDPFTLTGDRWFESISKVVPDGEGGLIFTHTVTPPPWPPGSILWLPAGADKPELLAAPSAIGESPQAVLHAVAETDAGPVLVYLDWAYPNGAVRSMPLHGSGEPTELWPADDSRRVHFVAAGGGRILIEYWDPVCHRVLLDAATGDEIGSPFTSQACNGMTTSYGLSADGTQVWYAHRGGIRIEYLDGSADAIDLPMTEWATIAYDGYDTAVATSVNGHSIITRTTEGLNATVLAITRGGWIIPYVGMIDLSPTASLGIGSAEFPCTDRVPPLPHQQLPDAVAETRRAVHAAIEACDWVALTELAGDQFSWGQGWNRLPVSQWIDIMRRDGADILGDIATVLTLPAIASTQGDGEEHWVWPAVAVLYDRATTADWQALLPLYSQQVIDQHRLSESRYAGLFMLWITDDGTWKGAGPQGA